MTHFFVQKMQQGDQLLLVPTTQDTKELVRKFNFGTPIRIEAKQPRHGRHHRLYWQMLRLVVENSDYETTQELHEAVKLRLNMYTPRIMTSTNGTQVATIEFHSINFNSMDQGGFGGFFERAQRVLAEDMGFDIEAFLKEAQS